MVKFREWGTCREWGRVARLLQGPLILQQFHRESSDMDESLRSVLLFGKQLLLNIASARIPVWPMQRRPTIIYSDAAWGDVVGCDGRAGWIIFPPDGSPKGAFTDVRTDDLGAFDDRSTYIGVLETLPALLIPMWDPEVVESSDIIWFVDNQGAASSLAKGASGSPDIDRIVSLSHLLWARCRARVWLEWVDSKANVADGISRDGFLDKASKALGFEPAFFPFPDCKALLQPDLGQAFSHVVSSVFG